ncbi:NACHT domain-containing protein [Streptomyces sp. DH18]|uniref:serine protease n=1 Tax=Streptomyces sp. DH18 TaxID=3040126 RepID=UPI0024428A2E|nr:serine protease [Streptomyces sp. DH18]MDG9685856.1 NACHT domain-containing protein [Streptomyces sp. DH18]
MNTTSPSGTHPSDRTVVVSGVLQGSGVLLTDLLILTCAHVVKTGTVHVAHPAGPERTRATVAWIDYRLDVALLQAIEPVRPVPPVRLGVVDTRQAIPGCEITGFPRVQRYGRDQRLEADQYTATVLPMAGRVRDLLVCDLDGPPAARPDDEPAALSGLSGGPVFMGDVLLGVARQVPLQRDGRRVECVPLAPVLAAKPFRLVYQRTGIDLRQELVHGSFPRDLRYEAEYAQALGVAYRRTKIFGLDELSRHDAEWDLDTAYLSLEAQAQDRAARHRGVTEAAVPLPQRIDALLADRPRVLLRGEAGAGKTTLLWWLAAHASARTLSDALAPLNGLIPFVVPLRTLRARGGTFPGPAELSGAAGLVIDAAPEGWAGRVLASGRALLLVDGLDEVPPEDREQAHSWLAQLLDRYPDTRCVATVRPLAVEPDWLRSEGFGELRLLPMRNEDIQVFVASWHRAARLSEEDDADRLDELERDLSHQFDQNPTLRDLARTPLLCAVICALHRRRDGFLPETRWKLYRSALEMLLGHRDHRRRIGNPEGIELDVEESTQLLQRIAVWLVREGQSEFTRGQALRQLGRALAGMERVRAQGPPEKILTHLLNRSGLLQEHADDTYQFIHRTFQDYLAAKELIEDAHLGELLRHADEEPWQDVILLAAGHCGRRELGLLVTGLLDAGLAHEEGSIARVELHVLGVLCAQHAAWLDGAVRDRARASVAALFPPTDDDQVEALSRLGEAALEFLPDPESLPSDHPSVQYIIQLLGWIGGQAAVPHARAWALAHADLGHAFIRAWNNFPPGEYASQVLESCRLAGDFVLVSRRHVRYLPRLKDIDQVLMTGDLMEADFRRAVEAHRVTRLGFDDNQLISDLGVLASSVPDLALLHLSRCSAIQDFEPLVGLTALDSLGLYHCGPARLDKLPALPRVVYLSMHGDSPISLSGLSSWHSLTSLALSRPTSFADVAAELRAHAGIVILRLAAPPSPTDCDAAGPVPSVEHLTLDTPGHKGGLALLRQTFPALRSLTVNDAAAYPQADLTPLHNWPGLEVTIQGHGKGAAPDRW